MTTAIEYVETVQRPGKFESESPYTVLAYDITLGGCSDDIDFPEGPLMCVRFDESDRPMLDAIHKISGDTNEPIPVGVLFYERDDGFVIGRVCDTKAEYDACVAKFKAEAEYQYSIIDERESEDY